MWEYGWHGFDDSLSDYIQSEEYISAKQQERRGLAYLESLLNESQKKALYSFLDNQMCILWKFSVR